MVLASAAVAAMLPVSKGSDGLIEPKMQLQSSADRDEAFWRTDEFKMFCYKIQLCPKGCAPSEWGTCGYAHAGEKARRRDLSLGYSSTACPDMLQNGKCPRGDSCNMAHSAFEFWLHPQRYRTQMCRDGDQCSRPVCFFAHNEAELRKTDAPTTDASGHSLARPKFSMSGLKDKLQRTPSASTRLAQSQFARLQQLQQQQLSWQATVDSSNTSLDSICSAVSHLGLPDAQQDLLLRGSTQVASRSASSTNQCSNLEAACGAFSAPLIDCNDMMRAAVGQHVTSSNNVSCLQSPVGFDSSCGSSISPISLAGSRAHSGELCYCTGLNSTGLPAVTPGPALDALLSALLQKAASMQHQAQIAQQTADDAQGCLAALYGSMSMPGQADAALLIASGTSSCAPICPPADFTSTVSSITSAAALAACAPGQYGLSSSQLAQQQLPYMATTLNQQQTRVLPDALLLPCLSTQVPQVSMFSPLSTQLMPQLAMHDVPAAVAAQLAAPVARLSACQGGGDGLLGGAQYLQACGLPSALNLQQQEQQGGQWHGKQALQMNDMEMLIASGAGWCM